MLNFLFVAVLVIIFVKIHMKNNIYFDCIKIKVKVIGLNVEIQSKEKKHLPDKE